MGDTDVSHRGNFFKDERLDRGVTWILALLVTTSLSIGAWFFSGLTIELRNLHLAVNKLNTRIEVIEERAKSTEQLLLYRLERVEGEVSVLRQNVDQLKADKR